MRIAAIVLLPALLLGLTGCGAPTPEAAYLSTVREGVPSLEDASDADLISLGKQVCSLFDDYGFTKGFVQIVAQFKGTGVDAGDIVGPAIGVYCPEYSDDL